MLEDDGYRQSSQYRLWSFTPTQLEDRRKETNRTASQRVRASFANARPAAHGDDESIDTDIETLTVDEEQKIVQWGCEKLLDLRTTLNPPPSSMVTATAIQYLRRFYLFNSPMTYHPKQIMVCALYLAKKTGHEFQELTDFVSQMKDVTEDDVRAPEFLLVQALRFTLDVRHPMRALDGGIAELRLQAANLSCLKDVSTADAHKQINTAGDMASRLLKTNIQMTDAYFLYTPAQMWLAALLIVDNDLTLSYIQHFFSRLGTSIAPIKQKLVDTITECAEVINSYKSSKDDKAVRQELARIGKKLKKCQDPEKLDIVAVSRAKMAEKREGNDSDVEKVSKKRKLEREKLEQDREVFGPDLKSVKHD